MIFPKLRARLSSSLRQGALALASRVALLALVTASLSAPARAADDKTGDIDGRVLNATNGLYLTRARVVVEGTSIEAFSDDQGDFHLRNVPAGQAKLKIYYTGQDPLAATVNVEAGKAARQDLTFNADSAKYDGKTGTIKLDAFVVESQRFRNAQEIAINEERNAPNIKNVIAADALGFVPDGNVGEFVKFLPGVEIGYGSTYANEYDAATVRVRGFSADQTGVTIDGMPISSSNPASLTRATGLDMMSINNASRVEVVKVATPDMPQDSPGGAINLISRSAFEYARPTYSIDLTTSYNTIEPLTFGRRYGPASDKTYHTLPGARLSVAVPLSKTLGFTVSLSSDNKYLPSEKIADRWQTANLAINLTPIGGSSTAQVSNAIGRVDFGNPYLNRVQVLDSPWSTYKQSGNIKFDWRPLPSLTLTGNVQYSRYTGIQADRRLQFQLGNFVKDFSSTYVRTYQQATGFSTGHSTQMTLTDRDTDGNTLAAYFKGNFRKGPWSVEGRASHSISRSGQEDYKKGHFSGLDVTLSTGRIDFEDIQDGAPGRILAWDTSGNPLDYTHISKYALGTVNAQSGEAYQQDVQDNYGLDLRRELDFMPFPMGVKVGVARKVKDTKKFGRGTGYKARYTGPTLNASQIQDTYVSRAIYGLTGPQEWVSVYKLYDIYKDHPDQFNPDFDVTYSIGNYNSMITQTKGVRETADSAYAMFDAKFFKNRLTLVGGARQNFSTTYKGVQPYVDSKYNLVHRPDGVIYTDSVYVNGVRYDGGTGVVAGGAAYARDAVLTDTALRARLTAAGITPPTQLQLAVDGVANGTNSNNLFFAMQRLRARFIDRKRNEVATPQLQAAYKITNDLVLKLAWSHETQLPNIEDGSGAGGIITSGSSFAINTNDVSSGVLGGDGTITLSNPGLKPQITDSYNGELNYYTKKGGNIGVSYYQKISSNLQEQTDLYNTSPEYGAILQSFGLDPNDYDNYKITTFTNNPAKTTKRTGYEIKLSQNLGILGDWASRFDMFVNFTHRNNAPSNSTSTVLGYIDRLPVADRYAGGLAYSANRFSIRATVTYAPASITRNSTISYTAPGATAAQTYQVYNAIPEDLRLNLQGNVQLTRRYSMFMNVANITNTTSATRVYDTETGINPEYAHVTGRKHFGLTINAGVSAKF